MIGVINLGNSNLMSLTNSLDYLKIKYIIINDKESLKLVNKIILPGVGTFGNGVKQLHKLNLFEPIHHEVNINKKPILGICLGMQLLFESSEESPDIAGLCLLKGKVVHLPKSDNYSIPRIGWSESKLNFIFLSLKKNDLIDFYYIHSFYVQTDKKEIIAIETDNGITAAIQYENIYGCQFHPEKSHTNGLQIIDTFSKM
jgi:imidazole glycerol-phosphate synthase subunit HisH